MAAPPVAMPPGAWFSSSGAAVYQQQSISRFAGHFMPHRLCHHFTNHGWCRKEEACTFAHGTWELHPRAAGVAVAPQPPQIAVHTKMVAKGKGKGKGSPEVVPMQYATWQQFAFNVEAPSFDPSPDTAVMLAEEGDQVVEEGAAAVGGEADAPADPASAELPPGDISSSSPSRRKPAPLLLDEPGSPSGRAAAAAPLPTTPSAVANSFMGPVVTTPSASVLPRHQQLYSPQHIQLSPSSGVSLASTMASATLLASPMNVQLKGPLWPGTPVVASPQAVAAPRTPVPIPRGMLLQARTVVTRAEQGPPGLATCAPTPTTKAKNFGFKYPQPGWIVTGPAPAVMARAAPVRAK